MSQKDWNIFISYSRKDREIVAPLTTLMRITGASVFRDEDCITPGKQWRVVLTESLSAARTVVVFWSENSAESGPVRDEFSSAIESEKDVVPVVLDDTPVNESLSDYQWLDFRPMIASIVKFGSANDTFLPGEQLPRPSPAGGLLGGPTGSAAGALGKLFGEKEVGLTLQEQQQIGNMLLDRILQTEIGE